MYIWETENLVELTLPRNSYVGVWWEPGYERLFDHEFGPTREAKPCNPICRANSALSSAQSTERASSKQHLSFYGGSNYNKKISVQRAVHASMGPLRFRFRQRQR